MANSNFVIQNGLTVGPTTIFAGNGDIITSSNITVQGGGSFGGLNPQQIYNGTNSNVTAGTSTVTVGFAGSGNIATFSGSGLTLTNNLYVNSAQINIQPDLTQSCSIGVGLSQIFAYVPGGKGGGQAKFQYGDIQNATTQTEIWNAGSSVIVIDPTNAVKVVGTTPATNVTSGALQVAGGASVQGNLWVGGNVYTNTLVSTTTQSLVLNDPMVYLIATGNLGVYNYDIGIYSDYTQGGYRHTGVVRNYSNNSWNFFSNVASEPGSTVNWSDAGIAYDTVRTGDHIIANATSSTSTTTGALQVAGGVGIAKSVYIGGDGTNAITHTGHVIPSANVSYNIGSTSAWYNNFYGTSTHALYADLAENYLADRQYNPGTVLMFGGDQEVTQATADTTAVAGVVSTNPAHLMNGALTGPNVVALALTGRVPCNVIGPVAKGDLLVSAGFGYAKTNNTPAIGTVIGKALQDFQVPAKGVIEVVVGRY